MQKCKTCFGYGLWFLGEHTPMGGMDASDGMPTIKCPECGMSYNDKNKKIRNESRRKHELYK